MVKLRLSWEGADRTPEARKAISRKAKASVEEAPDHPAKWKRLFIQQQKAFERILLERTWGFFQPPRSLCLPVVQVARSGFKVYDKSAFLEGLRIFLEASGPGLSGLMIFLCLS